MKGRSWEKRQKKGRQRILPARPGCQRRGRDRVPKERVSVPVRTDSGKSDVGLGLAQALYAVTRLPLIALAEEVNAFETLQDVAFDDETGGALEAFML
jgi:hypothetical protein